MTKCKFCGGSADVPDRDSMSSRICVCGRCHSAKLGGDLRNILQLDAQKKSEESQAHRTTAPKPH